MTDPQHVETIRSSLLGKAVGDDLIEEVSGLFKSVEKSHGCILFDEGDPANGLYIVAKGKLKLTRFSVEGRESILHIAEPPSVIAEAAIFLGHYPAAAIALTEVELLFLAKEHVMELTEKSAGFSHYLLLSMAMWLKLMVKRIEELTLQNGTSRVAGYLLSLYESKPHPQSGSEGKVILPLKKRDLADMLNMHQPSLSRILRRLQDEHFISVSGKTITINDPKLLRRQIFAPSYSRE